MPDTPKPGRQKVWCECEPGYHGNKCEPYNICEVAGESLCKNKFVNTEIRTCLSVCVKAVTGAGSASITTCVGRNHVSLGSVKIYQTMILSVNVKTDILENYVNITIHATTSLAWVKAARAQTLQIRNTSVIVRKKDTDQIGPNIVAAILER